MRAILMRWLGNAVVLMLLSFWPQSGVHVQTLWAALLAIAVWGLLNALVKPAIALFKMATCLVHALTFGLSTLVVAVVLNIALFVTLGSQRLIPGFSVDSVTAGIRAALILSVAGFLLNHWIQDEDESRRGNPR